MPFRESLSIKYIAQLTKKRRHFIVKNIRILKKPNNPTKTNTLRSIKKVIKYYILNGRIQTKWKH